MIKDELYAEMFLEAFKHYPQYREYYKKLVELLQKRYEEGKEAGKNDEKV